MKGKSSGTISVSGFVSEVAMFEQNSNPTKKVSGAIFDVLNGEYL